MDVEHLLILLVAIAGFFLFVSGPAEITDDCDWQALESLDGHPVVSLALKGGGTPLEVVLVTAAGSRLTRRAATVAALSTEVLRRHGMRAQ